MSSSGQIKVPEIRVKAQEGSEKECGRGWYPGQLRLEPGDSKCPGTERDTGDKPGPNTTGDWGHMDTWVAQELGLELAGWVP